MDNKKRNQLVLGFFKDYPGAFLTGSRAFGWSSDDSDFDVCVFMDDKDRAFEMVKRLSSMYSTSEYYDSAKGSGVQICDGNDKELVTINPIPLHPLDMLCWWLATREIAHIGKIDKTRLGDRGFKHGAFELLRGFYKSNIQYMGAEKMKEILLADQAQARAKGGV